MPPLLLQLGNPGGGEVRLGAGAVGAADVDADRPVRGQPQPGLHLRNARCGAGVEALAGVAGRGSRQAGAGGGPGGQGTGDIRRRRAGLPRARRCGQRGTGQDAGDQRPVGAIGGGDRDPPGGHGDQPVHRVGRRMHAGPAGGRLDEHGLGGPDERGRAALVGSRVAQVEHVPVEPDALLRMRGEVDHLPAGRDAERYSPVGDLPGMGHRVPRRPMPGGSVPGGGPGTGTAGQGGPASGRDGGGSGDSRIRAPPAG